MKSAAVSLDDKWIVATAISGVQQIDQTPGARHDRVFAAWYGRVLGTDRGGNP